MRHRRGLDTGEESHPSPELVLLAGLGLLQRQQQREVRPLGDLGDDDDGAREVLGGRHRGHLRRRGQGVGRVVPVGRLGEPVLGAAHVQRGTGDPWAQQLGVASLVSLRDGGLHLLEDPAQPVLVEGGRWRVGDLLRLGLRQLCAAAGQERDR
nr:hypothetical protein DA06_07590 [Georgenia sp. SUBG003]